MTAARGAAPRRGRRFAGSRRSRPPERRFAWRAQTRSGRASRFPRSWRGRRPTRPRPPCRSSPSWPDFRGPRQTAAVIRHDSHCRYPIACTPRTEPLFRRIGAHTPRGLVARRAGILSLHAVVAVNDPYAGDRGAVRRQGHFFTLSHRCRADLDARTTSPEVRSLFFRSRVGAKRRSRRRPELRPAS